MQNECQYQSLDALKAILAVMVIAIHSELFQMTLYPWLRIAVPLFFMMSSYFLFLKKRGIGRFLVRLSKLYMAWFIVLLPITLWAHRVDWFSVGWWTGIVYFMRDLFFGSTFPASWFFSALAWSSIIVYWLMRIRVPVWLLIILSALPFSYSCLSSSYPDVIQASPTLCQFRELHILFARPHRSVTSAILWVVLGAALAEKHKKDVIHMPFVLSVLLFGCVLLYGEWIYVAQSRHGISNDCYFALPLVVVPFFLLIKNHDCSIPYAPILRQFSIVAYPLHFSVIICIYNVLRILGINDEYGVIRFSFGIIIVVICYMLVRKLSQLGIGFLRWLC